MPDVPGLAVALVVSAYWTTVGAMSVRRRRKTRRLAGVVPEQALERAMWFAWVPLVIAWMALPWLALVRTHAPLALPLFAHEPVYAALRWIAALLAVAALLATLRCWRQMGRNWTMAVTREEAGVLITDGMFGRIRHPIYALSIALMLCTLAVVPTWPMAAIATVHVLLMITKARNEERFLLGVHGARYADYCSRTGRFWPPLGRQPA